ncbi:Protein kinase MCK1, partial [Dissostichus eleginoides]
PMNKMPLHELLLLSVSTNVCFLLLSPHVHHASIEVHPPAHPSTCQQTAADATSFDMDERRIVGWIIGVVGEIELEKRLLVKALIWPFSADDDNNNHSQEWRQMGKREHRRLFKEAYTQLLSAIKTQISEDKLEQKAR